MAEYADWRRRPEGVVPDLPDVDPSGGRVVVERGLALAPDGTVLDPPDADRLLACYGIKDADIPVALECDPLFGPVLRVADRIAVLPLTDRDAADLDAARADLLLRIAALAEDLPEVAELTLGPAGAHIRIAPWHPRPELAMRRLR